ncbi:SRPBCC family protein [Pseudonocardia endophytica]|uniref:Uncharacterized protein YndB with AHSA1/START domain n=1 Tax=Pseudonocardia endophytica TaxID=401976 RepID=A0A4R1HJ45_PSEEN|nr:SRPBCC domain-containing protein [Pseudonocardia endophytica]TCK21001.1 uncharacterized protein YndB with AHSA1/START domain [Pseudonocardia endophytica]
MSRRFEIRREVALPATPEQVWRAIATPEGQAAWFMPSEPPPDAQVESEPPHRLAITDGGTTAMEYIVDGRDDGTTVLRFVHSGMLSDDWGDEFEGMTAAGWDMYLFTLGQYLRHFPDRSAVYAEAEAPAVPGAWDRILAALGDPAEGDTVDATGLAGVVDLRSVHYLGVRTDDALVRFHERSPIGLPVAVGHHAYSPGTDPATLSTAWAEWLTTTTQETHHDG